MKKNDKYYFIIGLICYGLFFAIVSYYVYGLLSINATDNNVKGHLFVNILATFSTGIGTFIACVFYLILHWILTPVFTSLFKKIAYKKITGAHYIQLTKKILWIITLVDIVVGMIRFSFFDVIYLILCFLPIPIVYIIFVSAWRIDVNPASYNQNAYSSHYGNLDDSNIIDGEILHEEKIDE